MSLLIVAPLGLFYIGCKRCHHQAAETKKNPKAEQVEDPDQSGSSFQEREALRTALSQAALNLLMEVR